MKLEISSFNRILVLTGAGISAESGLATFRDSNGLWENHRIEDVATPEAFDRDPKLVWKFYSLRRLAAAEAKPTVAHLALSRFSRVAREGGREFTLVTQNVDALHERATAEVCGPEAHRHLPIAMHGTLHLSRCSGCGTIFSDPHAWFGAAGEPTARPVFGSSFLPTAQPTLDPQKLTRDRAQIPLAPCCNLRLRPHIVWFGEMPLEMDAIWARLGRCDLFVTIGTSGQVYPAAGFLEQAKIAGATTVCLNKEPIPQQGMVDFYFEGPATKTVCEVFGPL